MSENTQLQEALKFANDRKPREFAQMLRRLAIALKDRNDVPFSEDEVQILLDQFSLSPSELESLFSACQYVLQQAAAFSFTSEKIEIYATQCGLIPEIAQCFSAVWDAEGEEVVNSLKQRTITNNELTNTIWRLNMKAAEKGQPPSKTPVMLMDLNVEGKDPITIQFNHEEFSKFYEQIEQIQREVDRLT